MPEVGGNAAIYLSRLHAGQENEWAHAGARLIEAELRATPEERERRIKQGLVQAQKFNTQRALDQYEAIYLSLCAVGAANSNPRLLLAES